MSSYPESIASNESFNQDCISPIDDDVLEMKASKDLHAFSLIPAGIPVSFKMLTDGYNNNRVYFHPCQWTIGNYAVDMSLQGNNNAKRKRAQSHDITRREGKRVKSPSISDEGSQSDTSQSKQMSSTSSSSTLYSLKKKDIKPLSQYIDKNTCQTSMGRKNDIGQKLQLALLLLQERKRRLMK